MDPLLDCIVEEQLTRLHDTIHAHHRKHTVIWLKLMLIMEDLEPLDPHQKPDKAV